MKEIMMPVLLLDEGCRTCEFLEIESYIKNQMWSGEVCVNQDIEIRCKDVVKCQRLRERNGTYAIRE